MPRRPPPRKQKGIATGRRTFTGAVRDVAGMAAHLGASEKTVRAQVARKLLPHRRLSGRVIFVVAEVDEFLRQLPGVSPVQALANLAQRNGRLA